MNIYATPQYIVAIYNDYQVWHGNSGTGGPAKVYYSKADFQRVARHYGWGEVLPTDMVSHCGDTVQVFEILVPELRAARIVWQ